VKILLQTFFWLLLVSQICFGQGTWTKIGDMPEIRLAHTVNEINGKVYVVGGLNTEAETAPTTTLVYDRFAGTWDSIPLLNNEAKAFHTSCVADGKLYVIGGWTGNPSNFGKMEMFDPDSGYWISKNPMPTPRGNLACASTGNKIYVIGGMSYSGYTGLKTMEVYDISTDTWSQLADMPTGRWGPSALEFNGKIYVFGGTTGTATIVYASVEVYDPQTNTWVTKSNMPTKRYQLTTCILDTNIYAIGGWLSSDTGPIYDKVEEYNPESDTWYTKAPLPVARALLASIVFDDKIYVYGGSRTNHPLIGTSDIYEFTPPPVSVEIKAFAPLEFILEQNYPNPFNSTTAIHYSIPQRSNVTLKVYDILGNEVVTLVNEEKEQGVYTVNFDANNLASGMYLYRIQAGSFIDTKKMILLK
jgi:N-acetylneuraminic acid mutarotase